MVMTGLKWLSVPVLWLVLASGITALARQLEAASPLVQMQFRNLLWLTFAGLAARMALGILGKRWRSQDPLAFVDTLEHELTHVLGGYCTFSPPSSLRATALTGGEVTLKRLNLFSALCPYFFPLWAGIFLGLSFIVSREFLPLWEGATFFLLGNFFYRLALEVRTYQTDLKIYGFFFSISLIGVALLGVYCVFLWNAGIVPGGIYARWAHEMTDIFKLLLQFIITHKGVL